MEALFMIVCIGGSIIISYYLYSSDKKEKDFETYKQKVRHKDFLEASEELQNERNIPLEDIEYSAKNFLWDQMKTKLTLEWNQNKEKFEKKSNLLEIKTALPFASNSETYDENLTRNEAEEWLRKKLANELYEKLDFERNARLLLNEFNKFEFVGIPTDPIEHTGDSSRLKDWAIEVKKRKESTKYLYLVQIKSRIDDKNYIKIGITSKKNIKKRFEDDDVMELKKIIRSVRLETNLAMSAEYFLIRKYRPKNYFAEKEFDVFSRFGGYTEVVPMRNTTEIGKDIDKIEKNSKQYSSLIERYLRLFDPKKPIKKPTKELQKDKTKERLIKKDEKLIDLQIIRKQEYMKLLKPYPEDKSSNIEQELATENYFPKMINSNTRLVLIRRFEKNVNEIINNQ
ncbi:hypothetical protein N8384_03010 [Candidatus Thioglobus sp.]|nr:hypothetical protein [Candidatus Thioglobus sp.]